MLKLNFETQPKYDFSNDKQFSENEKHVTRRYNKSVLILMRKGVLRFTENGIPIELKAGEYYIQQAGLYQQGLLYNDLPNYYFIHFTGEFSSNGDLPLRGTFDIVKIQDIIAKIKQLGNTAKQIEYDRYFYEILLILYREVKIYPLQETLKSYILENFEKPLHIKNLALRTGFSENHIINVFKNSYGITPHKFLIDYRLKKACELIISSDVSIFDISISVGFSDYSIFYRAFKNKFGISPEQYRFSF